MSYDFFLFAPERTDDGEVAVGPRDLAHNPVLLRRYFAETVNSTPELDAVAALITNDIEQLTTQPHAALIESASVAGDRVICVPVTYSSQDAARGYLIQIALTHGLGLADASDNFVLLYGDEDPRYHVQAAEWGVPALSRAALEYNFDYIVDNEAVNPYFILSDATNDENYIQTCVEDIDEVSNNHDEVSWRLEYRAGSADDHYGTFVTGGAKVAEMMRYWLDNAPEFAQLDWEKMEF
ncbi:MAG: hypothetical protein Q4D85_10535 [Corynebacterium sp.]|uniref:hypothetical protein n=1 Tax=Corynebacterium sp. TaxID=1720 RepID=UPI0026DA8C90|nr:hypothetical protein [Corynebacterium sp.]MDO5099179.1 hypothetical protein [Corynebacterium sp.]